MLDVLLENNVYKIKSMEQRRERSRHLIPMFIGTPCMLMRSVNSHVYWYWDTLYVNVFRACTLQGRVTWVELNLEIFEIPRAISGLIA